VSRLKVGFVLKKISHYNSPPKFKLVELLFSILEYMKIDMGCQKDFETPDEVWVLMVFKEMVLAGHFPVK
jgi:hypothetical protein